MTREAESESARVMPRPAPCRTRRRVARTRLSDSRHINSGSLLLHTHFDAGPPAHRRRLAALSFAALADFDGLRCLAARRAGARQVRANGGTVIVESRESALIWGMPAPSPKPDSPPQSFRFPPSLPRCHCSVTSLNSSIEGLQTLTHHRGRREHRGSTRELNPSAHPPCALRLCGE